jgi:hypothetical protein
MSRCRSDRAAAGATAPTAAFSPSPEIGRIGSSPGRKRKGSQERSGRTFLLAFPDCLFPRRQGVTGMNATAFPASLTGRIWFFLSNYGPLLHLRTAQGLPTRVPLTPLAVSRRFSRRQCRGTSPGDPSQRFCKPSAAERLRRLAAGGGARPATGPACVFAPSPCRARPAACCRPWSLRSRIRPSPFAWAMPNRTNRRSWLPPTAYPIADQRDIGEALAWRGPAPE